MQYLYLRDMTPETDSVDDVEKAREMFWEQAESGEMTSDERVFKKAKNYAEKMIDGVLFYLNDIDEVLASFSEKWEGKTSSSP